LKGGDEKDFLIVSTEADITKQLLKVSFLKGGYI
jgi:hypothetical protein